MPPVLLKFEFGQRSDRGSTASPALAGSSVVPPLPPQCVCVSVCVPVCVYTCVRVCTYTRGDGAFAFAAGRHFSL